MKPTGRMTEDDPGARPHASVEGPGADSSGPAALSVADDRFLEALAARVRGAGLAAPAVLWLGGVRPLSFLGSQVLHAASPLIDVFLPDDSVSRLAGLLEDRAVFDRFLSHLEASDGSGDVPS